MKNMEDNQTQSEKPTWTEKGVQNYVKKLELRKTALQSAEKLNHGYGVEQVILDAEIIYNWLVK